MRKYSTNLNQQQLQRLLHLCHDAELDHERSIQSDSGLAFAEDKLSLQLSRLQQNMQLRDAEKASNHWRYWCGGASGLAVAAVVLLGILTVKPGSQADIPDERWKGGTVGTSWHCEVQALQTDAEGVLQKRHVDQNHRLQLSASPWRLALRCRGAQQLTVSLEGENSRKNFDLRFDSDTRWRLLPTEGAWQSHSWQRLQIQTRDGSLGQTLRIVYQ